MEINRAFISLLRLTEVDDLLRQLSYLARQGNIGFADLPRFLTNEITLKLSTVPALAPAIDALRNGFAVMMNPLMDIQFPFPSTSHRLAFFVYLAGAINSSCVYNGTISAHCIPLQWPLLWRNNSTP